MIKTTQKTEQVLKEIKDKGLAGVPIAEREKLIANHLPMVFRHFKGNYYVALEIVHDCDKGEPVVVYQAVKDKKKWIRPLSSFASYVDNVKYPNVNQPFRLCTPNELFDLGYTFNDLAEDIDKLEIQGDKIKLNLKLMLLKLYEMYKLRKARKGNKENE